MTIDENSNFGKARVAQFWPKATSEATESAPVRELDKRRREPKTTLKPDRNVSKMAG